MSVSFGHKGSFENLEKFLARMENLNYRDILEMYAREGTVALSGATPIDSSITSGSWSHQVIVGTQAVRIVWTNDSQNQGFQIAVALQYGYATGTGGYVSGRDYINPAIKPIFDAIADGVWKVVTSA